MCSTVASLLLIGSASAEEFAKAPLPAGLVPADGKVSVAAAVAFLEGPAVDGGWRRSTSATSPATAS